MYNDQDRPPWLRNLRTPRPEPEEPELYERAPTLAEPIVEPYPTELPEPSRTEVRRAITRRQMLILALLLWGNVSILGCLCLLATGTVVP
ncbi:MAG: hypothetical protein JSV81_20920 [Anaerolineales bacterium]|nr:MAG: hypothetical protein JSV81_20920 [Anaerolineales bacterium]